MSRFSRFIALCAIFAASSVQAAHITATNVSALSSARVGHGDTVQTRGYSTTGIGANLYRYDRTSSATVDGGFIINGPGGLGRYIAIDQSVADVAKFGAIPDDGTNDATAIQAAINSGAGIGVQVKLPAGTFHISSTITVPAGNTKFTLVGAGRAATVINATALNNVPAIDVSNSTWTKLSSFTLQGDSSSGHGIQGVDPHWLTLAYLPQHMQIDNVFITGFTGEQTMLGTSFGLSSPSGDKVIPACGIFLAGALENHIADCVCLSNDIGMYLYACGQPKVERCAFDANASAGIVDQNNESPIYDKNDILTASTAVGATFNLMINSPRRGALTVDAAGIVSLGSHGAVISNNKFKGSRVNIVTESDYAPVIRDNWIRADIKTGILNYGPARIEQNTFFPAFIATKTFTTNFGSNDKLTSTAHGFSDGEEVILYSSGTLPAGLFVNTPVFVKSATANDFEVSVTPGGASLDITGDGTGTHTVAVARREVWFDMPSATTCNIGSVSRNVFAYGGGGATHAHIQASSPAAINPIDGLIEGNYFGQPYAVANPTRVNFNVVTVGTVRALTVRDNVHHVPEGVTIAIRYIMPDNAVSPGPIFENNVNQIDEEGTIQFGDFFPANSIYRTAGSGRVMDVVQFGADPTGTVDSVVSIVTAINNLQPGDELHFPRGMFLTSGNLSIPAGVKVTGPGELKATGATAIPLVLSDNCIVDGLHVNGNGTATYGIFIGDGVSGCKVIRCRIGNMAGSLAVGIGIEGDGANDTVIDDNDIYDCVGVTFGRGISVIGDTSPTTTIRGVKITNNRIDNIQPSSDSSAILVRDWTASVDVLISGNTITNSLLRGILIRSPGVIVSNNHITIPGTSCYSAIDIQNSSCQVIGNHIYGAANAIISLGSSLGATGNLCANNRIEIPASHGVANVDAIVTEGNNVQDVQIIGNIVTAGSEIRSFVSFEGDGDSASVSSNSFSGTVAGGSAAIYTGLDSPASAMHNVTIHNNTFRGLDGERLLTDFGQTSTGIYWLHNITDGTEVDLTGSTTIDVLVKGEVSATPVDSLRARVGSFVTRKDGGSGTTGYLKESGSDTSGWVAIAPGGGGVSDGDKTDITVSGSGATWTIDSGVVTYAKLQDVSATSRMLGRITTGAGDVEELTAANVRTIINVEDGADVTDSTNVEAAGAVMVADTSIAGYGWVLDEDDFTSNSATKVATQQSTKAYIDAAISGVASGGDGTFTTLTADDATPDVTDLRLVDTANTVATNYTDFENGTEGQLLEIHVLDANTSFTNNSNIALSGGANIPASSSPYTVILRREATQWKQIGYETLEQQIATSVDGSGNITLQNTATDGDIIIQADGTGVVNIVADELQLNGTPVGGGLPPDADYGDIAIASGVWTIDAGVVTYAKMQDVSATSRVLGRITGGAGDVEELTAANIRTIINVEDGADVTDSTNVDAAGAVMVADTATTGYGFVVDDDTFAAASDTKVPTAQSVKAYVDANAGGLPAGGSVGDLVVNTGSGTGAWSSVVSVGANGATIAGGTVTDPATPMAITQTWNDAADTFDAIDVNVTNTASAAASRLINLRVGGTTQFNVTRAGSVTATGTVRIPSGSGSTIAYGFSDDADTGILGDASNGIAFMTGGASKAFVTLSYGLVVDRTLGIGFASGANPIVNAPDVWLIRDGGANRLSLRNQATGSNPQSLSIYTTYTDITNNYERLRIYGQAADSFRIHAENGSSGGTARGLALGTDETDRLIIAADGSLTTITTPVQINGHRIIGPTEINLASLLAFSGQYITNNQGAQGASTNRTLSAGNAELSPLLISKQVVIDQLASEVVTTHATNTFNLLLFDSNSSGFPNNKLYQTAALAADTTGIKTETIGSPITLEPGLYWIGWHSTGAIALRGNDVGWRSLGTSALGAPNSNFQLILDTSYSTAQTTWDAITGTSQLATTDPAICAVRVQ